MYMSKLYVMSNDPSMSGTYECRAMYNGKSVVAATMILVEGTGQVTYNV